MEAETAKGQKMKMQKRLGNPVMAVMICAALLLGSANAQTVPVDAPAKATKAKKAKKKAVKSASANGRMPKFLPGSQETTKERSTRLKLECKGAANAGVCKGYTG